MKETKIEYISLEKIRPSKTNPRKHFDENYIVELSDSIRAKGILQPLLTRPDWCIGKSDEAIRAKSPNGDHAVNGEVAFFEIVAGECRYRGASKAQLTEAPAIVRLLSDKETLEIQLIENLQRSDLTPIEEAQAYRRLIDEMGYTAELIHEKTGKSIRTIYGKLKMLKAPKLLLEAVEKGMIGERFCELVGRIPIPEAREQAAREILHPKFLRETRFGTLEEAPDQPLSYRAAADHVRDNYMRSLSSAEFDQGDATLVAPIVDNDVGERIGGGACTDCPMKSGNRPELFGDLKRPDICSNPKCFAQKTDAHFVRLQETATAEGKKILSAEEAREVFEDENRLWFDSPYVKLSDQPDRSEVRPDVKKIPSWKKLLAELPDEQTVGVPSKDQKSGVVTQVKRTEKFKKPQIVIARSPGGRVVELIDRSLAIAAVNQAAKQKGEQSIFELAKPRQGTGVTDSGYSGEAAGEEPAWKKQDRKNREIAKTNFQTTLAVMTELIGTIGKKGAVKGFWDALIQASITHAGHDGCWLICKRLGLDPKNHVKAAAAHVAPGVESAALEYGLTLPDEEMKLPFVVELLLSQQVKFSCNSYGGGLKHVHVLKSFLDLYKVDVTEIEKRVRVEAKEKNPKKKLSGKQEYGKNLSGDGGKAVAKGEGLRGESKDSAAPQGGHANAPLPAQKLAKHKWEKIAGDKYHCRSCGAAAVKNVKGQMIVAAEFRGKPCVGITPKSKPKPEAKPRKALPRGKASPRGKKKGGVKK